MSIPNTLISKNYREITLFFIFFVASWSLTKFLGLDTLGYVTETYWQYLDLLELKKSPYQSLLYLHSQPPLLNAVTVLLLNFPGDLYDNFLILNSLLASITSFIIFKILFHYCKSYALSIIIAAAYLFSPATLLNVAYPFYPILISCGYAVLIYSFFILRLNSKLSLLLFAFSIIYLSLLRASFTIYHVLLFSIIFYYYAKNNIRVGILVVTLISAILISLIVPFKNYLLYDFFGSTSWAPLNISQGVGIKSVLPYFPEPTKLIQEMPDLSCARSYGVQDKSLVKQNGQPNYNSCYLIAYGKVKQAEFFKKYNFRIHFINFLSNSIQYFSPPDKYSLLENRLSISRYADFSQYYWLTVPFFNGEVRLLVLIIITTAVVIWSYNRDAFIALILLTIIIHFLTHTLTNGNESKRFVFDIEFLFYILFGLCLNKLKFKHACSSLISKNKFHNKKML